MKKTLSYMLLGAVLCSCAKDTDTRPVLAVSVEPQAVLLREIAGPGFRVVPMLTSGADAESFEPTLRTRADVEDASLVFVTGALPFEEKLTQTVSGRIVNTSNGIDLIYGTHGECPHHGHHHDHDSADPHTWASVRNARVMAANMFGALSTAYPDSAEVFGERFKRLNARLDSLDRALSANFARSTAKSFAIWHPSLTYFARDYGLRQVSVGFENKEMTAGRIAHAIEDARADSVCLFVNEAGRDTRQSQQLVKALGVPSHSVNIMGEDFLQQLDSLSHALAR